MKYALVGKSHKFKAKRVEYDGIKFSSMGEAGLYQLLKLRERAGEIRIENRQDRIQLSEARIVCVPDFKLLDLKTQKVFWAEFKGMELATWKDRKKLWKVYGPGRLEVWKSDRSGTLFLDEVIEVNPAKGDARA